MLIGSDDGSIPRLGPRTWWVYLALGVPKTPAELSAEAGIVEPSMWKHLRRLEKAGLVARSEEPGSATLFRRVRELDQPTVYALLGRVQRARLAEPRSDRLPEFDGLPRGRVALLVGVAVAVVVVVAVVVLVAG